MNNITDFSFEDVMGAAVKLYGQDEVMESCTDLQQLEEWLGGDSISKIVEELEKQ